MTEPEGRRATARRGNEPRKRVDGTEPEGRRATARRGNESCFRQAGA